MQYSLFLFIFQAAKFTSKINALYATHQHSWASGRNPNCNGRPRTFGVATISRAAPHTYTHTQTPRPPLRVLPPSAPPRPFFTQLKLPTLAILSISPGPNPNHSNLTGYSMSPPQTFILLNNHFSPPPPTFDISNLSLAQHSTPLRIHSFARFLYQNHFHSFNRVTVSLSQFQSLVSVFIPCFLSSIPPQTTG